MRQAFKLKGNGIWRQEIGKVLSVLGGKDVQEMGKSQKFQKIGETGNKVRQLILGWKGKYLGHKIGKQSSPLHGKD